MIGMNTSFGRSGVQDWWLQRLSAIFMLVYVVILSYQLISADGINYYSWSAIFSTTWMQVMTFLTVLAISIHAWVGLWIVSTDYINPIAVRNAFQAIVLIVCLGIVAWTGMIFWG